MHNVHVEHQLRFLFKPIEPIEFVEIKNDYGYYTAYVEDGELKTDISNIPLINEKYTRRFKRLYEILNQDEEIILIRKVYSNTYGAVKKIFDTNKKINYLSELLSKKFKAKITICIIDNQGHINKDNISNNIKLFNSFNELLLFIKSEF